MRRDETPSDEGTVVTKKVKIGAECPYLFLLPCDILQYIIE